MLGVPVLSCPLPGGKCVGCEVAEEVVGDGSRLVATAGELCSVMEY